MVRGSPENLFISGGEALKTTHCDVGETLETTHFSLTIFWKIFKKKKYVILRVSPPEIKGFSGLLVALVRIFIEDYEYPMGVLIFLIHFKICDSSL